MSRSVWGVIIFAILATAGFALTNRQSNPTPTRQFLLNEYVVRDARTMTEQNPCAPELVLPDLFRAIGPEATIFPTENYYYYQFFLDGRSFSGDVRLAADTRDDGMLQYVCYETYSRWRAGDARGDIMQDMGSDDGVIVTRVAPLVYDVAYSGESVRFHLNNMAQQPNLDILGEGEIFAGRGFDESGLIFDLIYIQDRKRFIFVLNRDEHTSEHFDVTSGGLYLGRRTGFVFYEDIPLDRFILVAIEGGESYSNTIYDGPFDQLAENFYEDVGFWNLVFDAYPDLQGQINEHGTFLDQPYIFSISSYQSYVSIDQLGFVETCKELHEDRTDLILCLTGFE